MILRHVVASIALSGFVAGSMLACSGPPVATDYDQTCKVDTDCAPVWSGGSCDDKCQCPNEAINKVDLSRYQGDVQTSGCTITACTCAASGATCAKGVCTLVGGGSATSSSSTGN